MYPASSFWYPAGVSYGASEGNVSPVCCHRRQNDPNESAETSRRPAPRAFRRRLSLAGSRCNRRREPPMMMERSRQMASLHRASRSGPRRHTVNEVYIIALLRKLRGIIQPFPRLRIPCLNCLLPFGIVRKNYFGYYAQKYKRIERLAFFA